jgi:hypothetical protein
VEVTDDVIDSPQSVVVDQPPALTTPRPTLEDADTTPAERSLAATVVRQLHALLVPASVPAAGTITPRASRAGPSVDELDSLTTVDDSDVVLAEDVLDVELLVLTEVLVEVDVLVLVDVDVDTLVLVLAEVLVVVLVLVLVLTEVLVDVLADVEVLVLEVLVDVEVLVLCESAADDAVVRNLFVNPQSVAAGMEDLSETHAVLGLDGYRAWAVVKEVFGSDVLGLPYLSVETCPFAGESVRLFRAGKTSEFGYLVLVPRAKAADVKAAVKGEAVAAKAPAKKAAAKTTAKAAAPSPSGEGAVEKRGKEVFLSPQFSCFACHTIEALGIRGGQRGPDLSSVGRQAEVRKRGLSAEDYLRESILDPCACFTPLPARRVATTQAAVGVSWILA